jgi:hypothetical protein
LGTVAPAFHANIDTIIGAAVSGRRRGVASVVSLDAVVPLPLGRGGSYPSDASRIEARTDPVFGPVIADEFRSLYDYIQREC